MGNTMDVLITWPHAHLSEKRRVCPRPQVLLVDQEALGTVRKKRDLRQTRINANGALGALPHSMPTSNVLDSLRSMTTELKDSADNAPCFVFRKTWCKLSNSLSN